MGTVVANRTTRAVVRVFGLAAALAGAEHGVGEVLAGPVRPAGLVIQSWPDSRFFRIEAGEPAFTIVPNLLVAGLLTLALSALVAYRAWRCDRGDRVPLQLTGLSAALFLAGGGFGPPLLGLAVAWIARGVGRPQTLAARSVLHRRLAAAFPWSLYAAVAAWLFVLPGLPLLDLTVGASEMLVAPAVAVAGLLLWLAAAAARAEDADVAAAVPPGAPRPQVVAAGGGAARVRVLVAYASRHGATAGIAERIAAVVSRAGLAADAVPVAQVRRLDDVDALVLGGAAYLGHWLPPAVAFAERHVAALAGMPVWLFSSGPLGTQPLDASGVDLLESSRPKEFDRLEALVHPRGVRVFFGAFDRRSKPVGMTERLVRRMPAAKTVLPDGDFRDWPAIERWAESIAADLTGGHTSYAA